jgi:hypothetical protein
MNINLISDVYPISINLIGNFKEIDLYWYIKPLYQALQNNDFDKIYQLIYKFKNWSENKKYKFKINAPILFKFAFFLFCKKEDYNK